MARRPRVDPIGGWHHVMNRGVDRMDIFFGDADRIEFGSCLAAACHRFGVEVHAYCLMDNHFHLLVRCPDGHLSDMVHLLCGLYARNVNERTGRVGHLFGQRFTSRLVTTDLYIATAIRYIHRNPLAIPGVERCSEYRWSSHRTYLGHRRAPEWMRTDHALNWFDGPAGFDAFVHDGVSMRFEAIEVVPTAVLDAVDLVVAERSTESGRDILSQRRSLALGVAEAYGRPLVDDLFDELKVDSASARRSSLWRAHRHLHEHPHTSALIAPVCDLLGLRGSALALAPEVSPTVRYEPGP